MVFDQDQSDLVLARTDLGGVGDGVSVCVFGLFALGELIMVVVICVAGSVNVNVTDHFGNN